MHVLLVTLAVVAVAIFLGIWWQFFWTLGHRKASEWFPQKPLQSKPVLRVVK